MYLEDLLSKSKSRVEMIDIQNKIAHYYETKAEENKINKLISLKFRLNAKNAFHKSFKLNIRRSIMSSQIKNVYCWNANSISNKFNEIILAINKNEIILAINKNEIILAINENEIDILAINETKIDKIDEYYYENEKFNCILNSRNRHGGGIAFIIRKEIDFV